MAITTLFELATQHGEISAHMSKYLQRQKHTFDIIREQNGLGDRVYRVFKGDKPAPIFQYRIPERTSTETAGMWAFKVKRELDKEWKLQTAKKVPVSETVTSPAPSPSVLGVLDCGVVGTPPDSPSISSSQTSSSTPTTPAPESSNSAAGASVPGDSGTSPPPTSSGSNLPVTTKPFRKASKRTGS